MDEDIRLGLKETSKNVQDIGRMIGSTKVDIYDLEELARTLRISANTVDTWVRTQKLRYET